MEHQNLWAPWRMEYIRNLNPAVEDTKPQAAGAASSKLEIRNQKLEIPPPPSRCFLCDAAQFPIDSDDARRRFVLLNDHRGMILLNLYPYTNGHLLVAIGAHLGDLTDLTPQQRADIMELTALAENLLRAAINPQGINIGINLGRCAGAGLPGHLHVHVVPRWNGDVNFMQTVGHVRVIPQAAGGKLRSPGGCVGADGKDVNRWLRPRAGLRGGCPARVRIRGACSGRRGPRHRTRVRGHGRGRTP